MTLRCDGCKYWDSDEIKQASDQFVIGWCRRAMPFWDATTWDDDYTGRKLLPEFADRKFFAQDESDYRADVFTTPDFFCAEHSPNEQSAGQGDPQMGN